MSKLFETFRRAMMFKTAPSHKESLDRFRVEVLSSRELLEMAIADYFERQAANWQQVQTATGAVFERKRYQRSQQEIEHQQARWKQLVDEMSSTAKTWAILNTTLPNGTIMRDATGAECARAGGFYAEVARHIKPTQVVGRHLTETDLQNLWRRVHNKTAA
jgi:hypothetical protein